MQPEGIEGRERLRSRRVRFASALKPWQDAGPLLIRDGDGKAWRGRGRLSLDGAERVDMPYPTAPASGLSLRRWTARWPLSGPRAAVLADGMLAAFPVLALLLPYLLWQAPTDLIRAGLIVGATCLFSASSPARQRLERDESVRIHARFWDRIIETPLPAADADDAGDDSMRRAFLLQRGLEGALTLAAESRNLLAPAALTIAATALILSSPDTRLDALPAIVIPLALGLAFLLEERSLASSDRLEFSRHGLSRLEIRLARRMTSLRQLGLAPQKLRELAILQQETAERRRTSRILTTVAGAAPFWFAAASFAIALAAWPPVDAATISSLLLLVPATYCAADLGRRLARILGAWRKVQAIKAMRLDQPSPAAAEAPVRHIETVRLDGVGFRLDPASAPLFTAFSLALSRGEVVALTGPSGSGKSTLLAILMGLRPPQAGHIVINGKRRDWQALSSYRDRIAGIFQDTPIGVATIRGVIGQNAPMVREAEILQAAADAGLASAITALPMGMQTLVVEGAFPQSLGQQLLITRALAQGADLLVLDETFSNLDRDVVTGIIAAVRRRDIAVLFATHRADLALLADRTVDLAPIAQEHRCPAA
ncbi:ATP-binding cassette domain-containing protein [Mesorhizobium sp. ANAO-SY3R2]|uniref:ATP-binding cassette domain-containing protein n=1 Tax=Mesorhizobium sp. ANAO-SY3R2 TaxID=3166644 RepID=UPI00366CA948